MARTCFLVKHATDAKRCHLESEGTLLRNLPSAKRRRQVRRDSQEILQILPLVGVRAFEFPKAVAAPAAKPIRFRMVCCFHSKQTP